MFQYVKKLLFSDKKMKFSKKVFAQAFFKKLVEFEAKPQGFKAFVASKRIFKGVLGNFS